jgi:hypothetical protein
MIRTFEDLQKVGMDNFENALKSLGAVSKSTQAIVTEVADYSKKAFEDGTGAFEKLVGVKTMDKAVEVQTEFVRNAYESFVTKAAKIGEIYADLAKESWKPFEPASAK